jgi:signal transduction histidine kinase
MRRRIFARLARGRLAAMLALSAVLALLVAGVTTALYLEGSYKAQKVNEVTVQAKILAATVTAALAFNDRPAAQEYVNALKANAEVRAAALYDAGGSLFVSYSRRNDQPPPETAQAGEPYFQDNLLVVTAPVTEGQALLGTVFIRTVTERFEQRLARYAGIGLLVIMAALLVAVLGTSQAAMSRANRELEDRASALAEANAKLQAEMDQRQKVEEALRQSQKMETVGQLTGGVAHDFNNLLTVILGNLNRVRRRVADGASPAQFTRAVENSLQAAERAAALTRRLLAFSRRQPLSPKPINVNKLVENMSDLLRHSLGADIAIRNVLAPDLWRAHADPNQLENAILNLAVNSRDAMPEGGTLTIETANASVDERYLSENPDVAPGQYVAISVTDTGAGMTDEVIEKAFEPFFTTKDVGKGTGLGLSQVYGFAKQSGGHVKIQSQAGRGTTVTMCLPRLLAKETPFLIRDERELTASAAPFEAVLVVEDDVAVREYAIETLQELGYRVFAAATGAAALDMLKERPEIALLLTDIALPGGMNGRELAREARRRRPDLKLLYSTGYPNYVVYEPSLEIEGDLVPKPFTSVELAAAVRKVLETDSPALDSLGGRSAG